MFEDNSHLKLLPKSILNIQKYLNTLICCPLAYGSSLTQFYPPYLAQILGYVVTGKVKIMHFVMVDADSHLKLLPTSILDTYKVIEHIDIVGRVGMNEFF